MTELHWAAKSLTTDTTILQLMMDYGSPFDQKDEYGNTPLMCAAAAPNPDACRLFLDAGADILVVNRMGDNVLTNDMMKNFTSNEKNKVQPELRTETTKLLIEHGADVQWKDQSGRYPLHFATTPECVRLLVDAGADALVVDYYGRTPLFYWLEVHEAMNSDDVRMEYMKLAIDLGIDLEKRDSNKLTVFDHPTIKENPYFRDRIEQYRQQVSKDPQP